MKAELVSNVGLRLTVDQELDAHQCRVLCSALLMAAQRMDPQSYSTSFAAFPRDEINAALERMCRELE